MQKHTTPQAPELQATLRMIKDVEKIDNVVMEVKFTCTRTKQSRRMPF